MPRTVQDEGPHPIDRHVGRRVAERRLAQGFNQSQLGSALGLTFQQIQKYEKGANRISASKLWETAKFLEVDISYFYAGLPVLANGTAEAAGPSFNYEGRISRHSLEISRLSSQLSVSRQRLVLTLIEDMAASDSDRDSSSAESVEV